MKLWKATLPMFALLAIACSEQKKLDEMHDATVEMKDTTKQLLTETENMGKTTQKMEGTTKEMSGSTSDVMKTTTEVLKSTDELKSSTNELSDIARQGTALAIRRDLLQSLYAASSGGKKLAEAGKYFMAFEFQYWNDRGQDARKGKREELLKDAVSEFFKDAKEFVVDGPTDAFAQPGSELHGDSNKQASFNALSAAMHETNRKQLEAAKDVKDMKVLTMLSIIVDTLALSKDVDQGKLNITQLPEYQQIILSNSDLAIRLLQARHNFIATVFLSETRTLSRATTGGLLWNGINAYIMPMVGSSLQWTLNLDDFNSAQIYQFGQFLRGSLRTRFMIKSLGIEPFMDSKVKTYFEGLQIDAKKELTGSAAAQRAQLIDYAEQMKDPSAPAALPK